MSTAAKRVAISLTIAERDELQQLAHEAGEAIATVAGTLDALRTRYPHELRHLPANLDTDTYLAEQTAALVAWRGRLDAASTDADPREVLAFGYELRTFAVLLQDRARRNR